ncbi:30S ribosomal protein S4 [Candidatus Roizmanbacteria bacterium RIFCSPLOWO2_01_FULL_37_12]|uniref:Small ribosomal subunit protein uS4 n=1 Tax=Candidatus Roizmanbacteria bacterium RIFCSPLOWO2_01_FULL_37_12 TaxID=1802056 RepID=A0A1F7IBT9_9BACT|nr:MAG: 30S ribosomal protein S4 [Candidatus Roizmanbacteria bacterium RIFCSPHIGHO2_01_FULL_37_16]OGK25988.1 MAG: 30S ribosomal protein S4 [Candidatus Roizmanbacteria bacterium RIFCSPHIGHO2_02_FULL_37_9b]OGK40824.1 MAG: 30S ribosomal protein S4 [Candidatus Roizmanbacteria bacterium RIFCSPLOWO2_01_FULL_37_12]
MRYTGPRNRIARREGIDLGFKTLGSKTHERLLKKLSVPPGQHGTRRRRKLSDHARQLREKQKLRYLFQLNEKQLKKYFKKAAFKKGNTAIYLAKFLEKRLDNVVFRAGLSPTRASARQLVVHGHIKVNDKKVSIPSYQIKKDDIITFSNEAVMKVSYIEKMLASKDILLPNWLEKKATVSKIVAEPTNAEIEKQINLRLVIEHYSR